MASAKISQADSEENKQSELILSLPSSCHLWAAGCQSNMNKYSVTVMPISHLKCFQNSSCSVLFSCKMRKFVTWQPCWDLLRKYQALITSWSTANRNALSLKWPVIGQSLPSRARFFKPWKQSHEEVQKSSYLSEHLNYNMLKGYYGIFAQWCQKILPTEALKAVFWIWSGILRNIFLSLVHQVEAKFVAWCHFATLWITAWKEDSLDVLQFERKKMFSSTPPLHCGIIVVLTY